MDAPDTDTMRRAVALATLIAVLVVAAILWYFVRRISLVGLCMVPVVCASSATLLAMRLLGVELNLMSAAIAPILVGAGVDYGVHMVARLQAGQAVADVLEEAGASLAVTTLTTVGGFACLSLATFTGIRELGILGALGITACLLAALHLVPLGWLWLNRLHLAGQQ
jgi:predicted RND superfamily exporter protein